MEAIVKGRLRAYLFRLLLGSRTTILDFRFWIAVGTWGNRVSPPPSLVGGFGRAAPSQEKPIFIAALCAPRMGPGSTLNPGLKGSLSGCAILRQTWGKPEFSNPLLGEFCVCLTIAG